MVVGLGGAGKTSLVRALMSNQYQSDGTSNAEITDGIDIVEWNVKVPSPLNPGNRETINYSIWDFAGQAVYYNSHQFFLSNRAIYLLLWNARLGYEHAGLDFWLSSIACHAPLAPVFVVGTHADQVFRADLPMQDLQETFSQIVQFCNISVLTGQGVKELADKLFDVTLRQSYMGERVPSNWLQFEKMLLAKRDEKIIPFQDMQQEAIESQLMLDSQDVKECLTLLHELGSIQYFNKDLLRSQIITNPQWLVDVMACLISVKENVIKNGRFKRKSVKTIWAKYPKQLHSWLLHLTEEFELTYALTTEKTNVVPCLLPETEPEYEWPELSDDEIQEMKLTYQFKYLPAGLFNRAQSRLCQYSDNAAVWKKGSLLHKNRHIALLRQTKDQELVLIVQGPKPENVLFLVLEALILEFFHGVSYDLSIPCIDCVHMGSQDPHMFSLRNVKRAIDLKAPFLQCMKNFHIVAIDSLTSLLPPSSTADYERHITGMLHELKELSSSASAMVQVLVLCHALDSQSKKKEAITAKRLCSSLGTRNINASQLVIAGKQTQVELGTKLASCQVMIAVISEQFCKDQACADIFSFIKRNVKRPLVCAVIDANDQQWRSTIVGAIVSTEIYVNFNSTSHYDDKMDELLQRIKSKVQLSSVKKKKKAEEKFDVFISYSWLNSKDAVAKGLKEIASSLGE
uniref:non-specific serine/threonine protein kinase n=1 Tax=Plectus sambesii TaxID=2011161 RepID=A0A914XFE4_9BILA